MVDAIGKYLYGNRHKNLSYGIYGIEGLILQRLVIVKLMFGESFEHNPLTTTFLHDCVVIQKRALKNYYKILEKCFLYIHSDVFSRFKYSSTQHCVFRRERFVLAGLDFVISSQKLMLMTLTLRLNEVELHDQRR